MSLANKGPSFYLVRELPKDVVTKNFQDHFFPFDASDLSVMHGKFPKLCEMGGVQGVAAALRTSPKTGLFKDEVEDGNFTKRRKMFGVNLIAKPPLKSFFRHCLNALEDPILSLLCFAGVLSIGLGLIESLSSGWIEGLAVLLAVFLVTTIGALNNMQQEREFRKLDESTEEPTYRVWRAGNAKHVKQSEIVVGDLVELAAGDAIPADGFYVFGDDPACNEAKMTGEVKDIDKDYLHPFLLAGTEVRKGQFGMIVTAVGINTSYGRIMASLIAEPEETPLQAKLEKVAKLIGYIGTAVAIILFFSLIAFFIGDLVHNGKNFKDNALNLLDFFIISVTIIVVAVPEGLPLAVTIALAYSMKKMVKDQNLVRVLSACETMGNATTICSDKTGTLTTNKMTVMKGWLGGRGYEKLQGVVPEGISDHLRTLLIEGVVINSKAKEEEEEHSHKRVWKGNQTEIALVQWMETFGLNIDSTRDKYIVRKNYPFDSFKKNSSIILKTPNGYRRYFKGAAEQLFRRATHIIDTNNREVEMGDYKGEVNAFIDGMTRTGLRTIGFAYQDFDDIAVDPKDHNKLLDPPEIDNLRFFGVVGIKDPLRPESRMSVRMCQRAGVIVRMVTGDHMETARFIATECGILTSPDQLVMEGEQLRQLFAGPKAEAERIIPRLRVLARSKPEDKKALVKWLKEHGEVVAATGDGTNDAQALKEANVGIAMNLAGTEVAKAAAEILILDDNFHSIVKSIMWGRSVFDNIRKFIQFQLTINLVALSITLIGVYAQFDVVLKAVQLLWINLIMDTMAALALGTEEPTMELLNRRPYGKYAPLVSRIMWRNIIGQTIYQLAMLMFVMFGYRIWDFSHGSKAHLTLIFNTFVFLQLFNEINSRNIMGERNVFRGLFTNVPFMAVLFFTGVFQVFMVELFGPFAETEGQTGLQWLTAILIGAGGLVWGQLLNFIKLPTNDGEIDLPESTFAGADLSAPDDMPYDPASSSSPAHAPVASASSPDNSYTDGLRVVPARRNDTGGAGAENSRQEIELSSYELAPIAAADRLSH